MIEVTRLDDMKIVINADNIRFVQASPDTIITFTSNDKLVVKEGVEEVSMKVMEYRRAAYQSLPPYLRKLEEESPRAPDCRSADSEMGDRPLQGR